MSENPDLPGSCGSCTVCCLALRIDEFGKQAGVMCQHCTGTGCGIYETRYQVCRGFMCGWRLLTGLGDAWRPDRSGILIVTLDVADLPEEYRAARNGLHFIVLGGEKSVRRPGFAEYVSTLVKRDVAVFLSADSPKTLINPYLRNQAANNDTPAVLEMLLHIYGQHLKLREMKDWKPLPWIQMP
jgi:hypothetical protein